MFLLESAETVPSVPRTERVMTFTRAPGCQTSQVTRYTYCNNRDFKKTKRQRKRYVKIQGPVHSSRGRGRRWDLGGGGGTRARKWLLREKRGHKKYFRKTLKWHYVLIF